MHTHKKTKLHQLTHASNQTRESRRLHPRPRRRRSVAPHAARRHRDAPLYARVAESCCVLDPSPAPHAWVVAPARTQGGRVGGVPGVSVLSGVSAPRMWGRYWDRGFAPVPCVKRSGVRLSRHHIFERLDVWFLFQTHEVCFYT